MSNKRTPSKKRTPKLMTVDAAANLYVPVNGEGNDRRFCALVKKWWKRMPNRAKDVMVSFWTEDSCRRCQFAWGPIAGLSEKWPGGKTAYACFRNNRQSEKFSVVFSSYYLKKMPDDVAVVLLAHEFGHLYQLATGTLYSHQPLTRDEAIRHFEREFQDTYDNAKTYMKPKTLEGAIMEMADKYAPVEVAVNRIVKEWRFSLKLLHRWDKEVGSTMPPPTRRYKKFGSRRTPTRQRR